MTFHALNEIKETGRFSLKAFYTKRYNRIFPGLLLMLLMSLVLIFFVNSDYRVDIAKQVASTFSFSTNWYEIVSGGSYEAQFVKHIFVHTWFLALEIHFYILWPLLLCLIVKIAKKMRIKNYANFLFLISILIALISYLILFIGILDFKNNVNWLYLSDFTRFSSFFIGVAIACIPKKVKLGMGSIISGGIYICIVAMSLVLNYNSIFTYIFGFLITDIFSALLIIIYLNTKKRELKIFESLSKYSYGIYLFHWPLLVLITSRSRSYKAYILVFVLTIVMTLFNEKIWQPRYTGKFSSSRPTLKNGVNFKENNLSGLLAISGVLLLFAFTFVAEMMAPQMVSLRKGILINSISQDIEKIHLDYDDLAKSLGKEPKIRESLSENDEKDSDSGEESSQDGRIKKVLKDKSVTVIGDSVLLGPRKYIMKNTPNTFVDSEGFRLLDKGHEVVQQLINDGKLRDYLVIALGTNAIEDPKESLNKILEIVPSGTRVILVTPHDINSPQHRVGVAMKEVAKEHNYITLMDWEAYAQKNPKLYEGTDGIHFYGREDTYEAYVKLLKETLIKASKTSAKK